MCFHICLGCVVNWMDEMIFSPFYFPAHGSQPPDHHPSQDPPAEKKKSFRFLFYLGFLFHPRIFIPSTDFYSIQDFYSIPGFSFHSRIFIPFQDPPASKKSFRFLLWHGFQSPPNVHWYFLQKYKSQLEFKLNFVLYNAFWFPQKWRLKSRAFFVSNCWTNSCLILGFGLSWGW